MSAPAPKPRSLAWRLTAWYAVSTMLLVALAVGFLYAALVRHLIDEDREEVAEHLADVRNELAEGLTLDTLQRIIGSDDPTGHWQIQVSDGPLIIGESSGFSRLRKWATFPPPTGDGNRPQVVMETSPEGATYVLASLRTALILADGRQSTATIYSAFDDSDEQRLLARYRLWIAAVLCITAVIAVGGGYLVARNGLGPVHALTATVSGISAASLGTRLSTVDMPSETASLADSFNAVLDRLEDSFARLARFSGEIAHELRTPLNVLRNEVEVALTGDRPTADLRHTLTSCLEEAERLGRLVDTLLLLARAEDPHASLAKEPVDLAAETALVVAFYKTTAEESGITLLANAQPAVVSGERVLLQRALGNLIENALAHTPRGGRITVGCSLAGDMVLISVSDNGPGIPPEHLIHVFERFYRVTDSKQRSSARAGLGLAIVRTIARLHRGDATIRSAPGGGTTVELRLPRIV